MQHYRCYHVLDKAMKMPCFSDTVEFCHREITQPAVTPADRIAHAIQFLSCALKDVPATTLNLQLDALNSLGAIFAKW